MIDEHLVSNKFRETVSLLNTTFEAIGEGLLLVDDDQVLNFKDRFLELWNFDADFRRHYTRDELLNNLQSKVLEPENLAEDLSAGVEGLIGREDGARLKIEGGKYLEMSANRRLSDNQVVGLVLSFRDVTDEVEVNEKLNPRARRDQLTGLLNRDE